MFLCVRYSLYIYIHASSYVHCHVYLKLTKLITKTSLENSILLFVTFTNLQCLGHIDSFKISRKKSIWHRTDSFPCSACSYRSLAWFGDITSWQTSAITCIVNIFSLIWMYNNYFNQQMSYNLHDWSICEDIDVLQMWCFFRYNDVMISANDRYERLIYFIRTTCPLS